MRIIFLDIDGVLNHNTFYRERQKKIKDGTWDLVHPYSKLDPDCVNLLGEFCQEYDMSVVISSTWRASRDVKKFNEIFSNYKFPIPVIDITPSAHHKAWVRGNEIHWWMQENEEIIGCRYYQYRDYVILDDDSDMLYWQRNNFLKVDRFVGITPQTIFEMKKILRIFEE